MRDSEWNSNSAMNELLRTNLDLQDTRRVHNEWRSRVRRYFVRRPVLRRKINRQEPNEVLDVSLETLLSKKCRRAAFRDFLKSEFCEENLDFWLTCQDFQTCENPDELRRRAAQIYDEFISAESPRQVNIDFNTREAVGRNLQKPGPSCFVVAQRKIYSLMENDSFPRFIQSEHHKSDGASEHRGRTPGRHFPSPHNVPSPS